MIKIKRALISVYDKTGILPLAKFLHRSGVEIISTGGTAALLKKAKIPAREVSSITRFPEMLDGRVKTLHPNLHAGLLAVRDNREHLKTLKTHRIGTIDLLVVNLYPFWEAVKSGKSDPEIIEMIDIGGPALLRSASKNFRFVAAVSDPRDYEPLLKELRQNDGSLSEGTRKSLASKVFKLTSCYDGMIHRYFEGRGSSENSLPKK